MRALFEQVLRAVEQGLNPEDYHASQLAARLRPEWPATGAARAATEILCTDALARLVVNLRFGKLDPADLEPSWNFSRELTTEDPVQTFDDILVSADLGAAIDALAPHLAFYRWLQAGLAEHRAILARGGWPAVPAGPTLQIGSESPRVAALRERLLATGDLEEGAPPEAAGFDADLAAAVSRFQLRHGLDPDGKVGPRTLAELNLPVEARIGQLRASLERVRWVFRDIAGDFIPVDIAGFHAHLVRGGTLSWSTRIQVGKPFHETPVFRAEMRYLVLNPTWTVPPGILRNETLPAIRRDPGYRERNRMTVVAGDGSAVDPATVDWEAAESGRFSYQIRQEPGPENALCRVKFMFPNQHMVCLRDTPSTALFEPAGRRRRGAAEALRLRALRSTSGTRCRRNGRRRATGRRARGSGN